MKKRFKEIYTRLHLETGAERKDLEEDERAKFGREEKLPSTDQVGICVKNIWKSLKSYLCNISVHRFINIAE
ncbi:hypothetical protein T12_7490 [Trichinella patagoniensis]|uniref:Uncharacterized protein n=1 Tax=Trichinella patagoniensis TaxID=990121 RepID=A0A0V0Z6Q3_9BILA|nr:hypothetical protein T12_7490 [Trichinella patagoniensis]